MALEMSWDTFVPNAVNSGMSTNWMPTVGRGCTPGLVGSASVIAVLVGSANAFAASRYCGISYVEARLPAGTRDQPSSLPTRFSYPLPEAQEMNFQASADFWVLFSMAQDQAYSHPEALVSSTGACA